MLTEMSEDYYVHRPHWRATLSDGTIIYQNDFDEGNSWLELKEKIEGKDLYVAALYLAFRDNVQLIAEGAAGYYLIRSITASWGGPTQLFIKAGVLDGQKVVGKKWLIPEIVPVEDFVYEIDPVVERQIIRGKI